MSKPYLTYEKACDKNMTFAEVVRYYHPDASFKEVEKYIIKAEGFCFLTYTTPTPENTVNAIGYTQKGHI